MKIFIRQGKESDQRGFYPIRLRCEGHGGADAPITLRHVHSDKGSDLGHSEWSLVLVDGVHVAGILEKVYSGQGHYCGDFFHPTQGTETQWEEGER